MVPNRKPVVMCWATWYPTNENPLYGLFIHKHLELLAPIADLHVFTIRSHPGFPVKREAHTYAWGTASHYILPQNRLLRILFTCLLPAWEYLRLWMKGRKPVIFHLHVLYPTVLYTWILELLLIPRWVFTEHWTGFTDWDGRYDRLSPFLKRLFSARAQRFHAGSVVSAALHHHMQKRDLLPANTLVIPNPIRTGSREPSTPTLQKPFSFCTVCYVDNQQKNISGLLQVFRYWDHSKIPVELTIYGSGPDKNMLEGLCAEWNIQNHVTWAGEIPNGKIPEVYARHDAFVLFSNYETFSIATAEALGHGLPVIVTRCGGQELLVEEGMGICIAPGDEPALAQAIKHLATHYSQFPRHTYPDRMKNRFSSGSIRQQFHNLYALR